MSSECSGCGAKPANLGGLCLDCAEAQAEFEREIAEFFDGRDWDAGDGTGRPASPRHPLSSTKPLLD